MVDNIMLVYKYGDERLAIEPESYPSFEKLIEVIVEKWVNLRHEQVNLFYATPVLDKFLLNDSGDFGAMLRMASIFDMKYLEIDVKSPFAKKDISLELGPIKNICHVVSNDEPSSIIGVSNETSIVVHSSIGTPLLSAYWGMGLSHVGQTFSEGRIEFRDALAKFSIDGGFSVRFKRNDKQFVRGFCKSRKTSNTDCPWFVRASVSSSNGYFIILEFVNCHTCDVRLKREDSKQLSSKLVARLITKPLIGAKRPWNPKDVLYNMKQSYGQELDYKTAWHALSKANEELYGDEVSSYQQLWWYTTAASEMNPGSKIVLEVEETTNTFKPIFLAWGACIEGFKDIRPMLFLDGTFLKGKLQGVLLLATGKNSNQELYPLAYAVVDGETKANWEWFMRCLREVVGSDRRMTFISDRNEGLLASIQTVFPESPNFFCLRHLQDNIKGRYTGMTMKKFKLKMVNLLMECTKATTLTDFETYHTDLRHIGGKIVEDFLMDMPFNKWTNLYAGLGHYGEMTSNGAESFNNWIMDARELPITQCIDKLRQKLMEWFI